MSAHDDLRWILDRIGSWTNARWDQHLRSEFGDERANAVMEMVAFLGPGSCFVCFDKTGKPRLTECGRAYFGLLPLDPFEGARLMARPDERTGGRLLRFCDHEDCGSICHRAT